MRRRARGFTLAEALVALALVALAATALADAMAGGGRAARAGWDAVATQVRASSNAVLRGAGAQPAGSGR